jgi:hypothetical protein
MKKIQIVFILVILGVAASLGVMAYSMFWGPDHIELAGRSISDLIESGDLVPLIVIPLVLIITAFSMRSFFRYIFPDEIKNGVDAQAKILKVWDTGMTINDNPQIGLLLEVSPPGGSLFQVEAKTLVSRLQVANVQPGLTAEVRYDPEKPTRIRVLTVNAEGASAATAASSATAARLQELDALRDKGLITMEEYRRKREDILKAL